jgi:hypothetical protein
MYQEKGSPYAFNFVPPADATETQEVLFPAPETQVPDYAATIAIAIKRMFTLLDVAALTGNATMNLTINEKVSKGANIIVKLTASGADRVFTPGTGMSGAATTVPSGSTVNLLFIFDGTNFRQLTAPGDTVLDGAITTAKLGAKAVTLAKLADGVAAGDIMWYNGTSWVILPKGTDGQVLKMVSGSPAWATDAIS